MVVSGTIGTIEAARTDANRPAEILDSAAGVTGSLFGAFPAGTTEATNAAPDSFQVDSDDDPDDVVTVPARRPTSEPDDVRFKLALVVLLGVGILVGRGGA